MSTFTKVVMVVAYILIIVMFGLYGEMQYSKGHIKGFDSGLASGILGSEMVGYDAGIRDGVKIGYCVGGKYDPNDMSYLVNFGKDANTIDPMMVMKRQSYNDMREDINGRVQAAIKKGS